MDKIAISKALKRRLNSEQIHTHYQQLPAVIVAPAVGALFTAWVLWDAVHNDYLKTGLVAVMSISLFRILIYKWYFHRPDNRFSITRWRWISISTAFISGSIWGSAAIFLYPPYAPEYEVFMLVLLALIPVAPVAALAVYMPAFYAYYIPSIAPFIIILGLQQNRPESMTAILLLMMMGATLTFASKYSAILAEAILLRLKLADKKEELEKAAMVKTRFLASASHDLRQPVHALGLFAETLSSKKNDPGSIKLIKNIEEATLNLRIMLDGMLDISRLDAQIVDVHRSHFNLGVLLQSLKDEYRPQALQKGLSFHYVATDLVVDSDPVLLERILRNLLSNAIKYTRQGGVLLGCRRQQGLLSIQVCDTGIGIPADQIGEIFMEFTQLQRTQKNSKKGLGLGLSIIKRLCLLLDHKVDVYSRPGKGSIFSVELPAGNRNKAEQVQAKQALLYPSFNAFLAVVIDDDESVRTAMQLLINEWGGNVIACETAQQALSQIEQQACHPNIFIVDYQLRHEKTALDAIAELSPVLLEDCPVVIITGDTDPERIKKAHNAGYMLLHKPVDPEQLKICIFELLNDSEN